MNTLMGIRTRRAARGFTLIELMIVVAVLGIIAAVAVPNYSAYIVRSKRASAKAVLLDAAGALERSFTTNGCYNRTTVANCGAQTGATYSLGSTRAPTEGKQTYVVAVDFSASAAGQAFTLTATPCATAGNCPAGSETTFADAECGDFTLANTGARGLVIGGTASTDNALIARCWQR